MNLTITPFSFNKTNNKTQNNQLNNSSTVIQPNIGYLAKDTVTFSGKNITKTATNTVKNIILDKYEAEEATRRITVNRLMDRMEAIAIKHKDSGVSFDRAYNEPNAVKTKDSWLSKLLRSGEKPLDEMRLTLFTENPYDLKFFKETLLPELVGEGRGYEIYRNPKTKELDLDIRLGDLPEDDIRVLPSEFWRYVSGPQKSGYEDIQMRLVDTTVPKKDRKPIELLIMFGKNYAKAKHDESYYVYDISRTLKNLLKISQIENPAMHSPAKRIQNNIAIITDHLNGSISRPLFINAKSMDFYHEAPMIPVELSPSSCKTLNGLLESINEKIPRHYKAEIEKIKSEEYLKEIEKLIKASSEYKTRSDKTISAEDIEKMRKTLIKQMNEDKGHDLKLITEVKARLKETIEKYGTAD